MIRSVHVICVLAVVVANFCAAPLVTACSMFCVARDGQVFFCNNEDYIKRGYIWFTPGSKQRFGRVNVGFDDQFPQGSMNEKGLAFDCATVQKLPWKADPQKETPRNLIEKIMDECQTVAEAIAYFEKYNCRHLEQGQFLFADATGDAAVITSLPETGLSISRIETDHLIATNMRLEPSGYRCQRYVHADHMLRSLTTNQPAELAQVLDGIHQRGPGAFTSYSNIFDLRNRKIYLYNLANYSEPVELDLMAELKQKTKRARPLAELFKHSPKLEELTAGEQRINCDTRIRLPDAVLDKFVGTYSPELDPNVQFRIKRGDGVLIVENPGQPDAVLFPESQTSFRVTPDRGQVTFLFRGDVDTDAQSSGLILHKARDLKAVRVE